MFCAAFFHSVGKGICVFPDCKKNYHLGHEFEKMSMLDVLLMNLILMIPILGGSYLLFRNREMILQKEAPFQQKVKVFCIVRVVLSILGLGVLFFLLDMLVILGTRLKNCCC